MLDGYCLERSLWGYGGFTGAGLFCRRRLLCTRGFGTSYRLCRAWGGAGLSKAGARQLSRAKNGQSKVLTLRLWALDLAVDNLGYKTRVSRSRSLFNDSLDGARKLHGWGFDRDFDGFGRA